MIDPRSIMLRSLRYRSPTNAIRESFYIRGNNIFCSNPSLFEAYNNDTDKSEQGLDIYINSYVRKVAKNGGTGRRRVRGYKRKSVVEN